MTRAHQPDEVRVSSKRFASRATAWSQTRARSNHRATLTCFGGQAIGSRRVHLRPLSNDVPSIPPKERVY